jgi:hypothetical protein
MGQEVDKREHGGERKNREQREATMPEKTGTG